MGRKSEIGIDTITPTTPLRLDLAARLAFPDGSIKASALRTEAKRGNLHIETIANKQFTTLKAIEEMRAKCATAKGQGSTIRATNTVTESSTGAACGSLETDRVKSALAALEMRVRKPSGSSPSTSPRNTSRRKQTNVIPLKS